MSNAAAMADLRKRIAAVRASARALAEQGMAAADIARTYHLPEGAVRDLLSDVPNVSPATTQALLKAAARRRA